MDLYECLCTQPEPRLDVKKFPAALCDFVAQCLRRDDSKRPDALTLVKHELVESQGIPLKLKSCLQAVFLWE